MSKHRHADRLAWALALLYGLDRLLKLLAVRSFFRRQPPPAPEVWPSVTVICPLTRSPNALRPALATHTRLDYSGPQRCLFVCDEADTASQALCREFIAAHPAWAATLLSVKPDRGAVASKVTKMRAAFGDETRTGAVSGCESSAVGTSWCSTLRNTRPEKANLALAIACRPAARRASAQTPRRAALLPPRTAESGADNQFGQHHSAHPQW